MKIKFLGTAAAEAIPGVFCECETCVKSRRLGGKNIRTRSQAIIDDKLLIDFPADTYFHALTNNLELSKIKTCLITHNHSDHLYANELWCRGNGIAYMEEYEPLVFYGAESAYRKISGAIEEYKLDRKTRVDVKEVTPFVPFNAEGYEITPLKARHDPATTPVIYLISRDGKTLLYAHDTGFFPDETEAYLKDIGVKLDFVSFDCTNALMLGTEHGKYGHMNLECDVIMRDILRKNGNVTDKTVCVVNHFSHNGHAPNGTLLHEDISAAAEKLGFTATYDGLEMEF